MFSRTLALTLVILMPLGEALPAGAANFIVDRRMGGVPDFTNADHAADPSWDTTLDAAQSDLPEAADAALIFPNPSLSQFLATYAVQMAGESGDTDIAQHISVKSDFRARRT